MTLKSVDAAAVTNAISPQTAAAGDTERVSDEVTVRNAISSVDPQTASGEAIAWANADTGSRGAISSLVESREANDVLCRQFTTTRESFDGVALYQGKACRVGPGSWQMMAFQAL
jgi:surface antigen